MVSANVKNNFACQSYGLLTLAYFDDSGMSVCSGSERHTFLAMMKAETITLLDNRCRTPIQKFCDRYKTFILKSFSFTLQIFWVEKIK
jgi:hypothetical protein